MVNKLYDKIKKIISENIVFFIILTSIYIACRIPFPYYINAPGGTIDIAKRIDVIDAYDSKGSYNLAYVSEYKATIPTLIMAYFKKDWDIIDKEEFLYENETMEEAEFRNHILLTEANQNAIIAAKTAASRKVTITNRELFVTYIDASSDTTLKIQDQILAVNGVSVTSKAELIAILSPYQVGDKISFDIMRNDKKIEATATMMEEQKRPIVGIMISEVKKLKQDDVSFHFTASESGPSGGFMMSLAIYDAYTKNDLTHGITIVGTGTIDEEGVVGSIGGIKYKLKGAVKAKADLFFVPEGENYEEAMKVKKENNYDIKIVKVATLQDAIDILEKNQANK